MAEAYEDNDFVVRNGGIRLYTSAVKNLGEYIQAVKALRDFWGLEQHKEIWFRGEQEKHTATRLRPQLYRPHRGASSSEGRALLSPDKLLDIEYDLHEEFKRLAFERCEIAKDGDWAWDSYFLMQHHEGPTRLLDWTDGALMALHFAIRDSFDDDQNAIIYVLDPYRLKNLIEKDEGVLYLKTHWKTYLEEMKRTPSFDINLHDYCEDCWHDRYLPSSEYQRRSLSLPAAPLVSDFPHLTRRISAQRSRFLVMGAQAAWLDSYLQNITHNEDTCCIGHILVQNRARSEIRQQLRDCGITESVIYPDLDGVGRELKQIWSERREKGH